MNQEQPTESRFMSDDRLPRLCINYPTCSHCGNDVEIEDRIASCPDCLIEWSSISEDAESSPDSNLDGTDVPCRIVEDKQRKEYDFNGAHWSFGPSQPCILPSGHEGKHLCPYETVVTR